MTDKSERPSPISGMVPPKNRRFGQPGGNPRHNGSWDKTKTARYQLEQMMKLSEKEVVAIANDKDAPLFSRRLARSLLKENDFVITERMINQVYGKPKETVETIDRTPKAIEIKVLEPKKDESKDTSGTNKLSAS